MPRIAYGSNPGNIGHNFLKRIFVDQCEEPNRIFYDKYTALSERKGANGKTLPATSGMSTVYIPCNFHSNPYIDPSYERQFAGLPPEQIKSLVHGDWDAAVGQAFFKLSREKHMVPDFWDAPSFRNQFGHFTIIQSYDHGSATPGASLWGLVPDQDLEINWRERGRTIIIPADSVVLFKEWYIAAENTDNTGLKLAPEAIARGILKREQEWGINPDIRVADYQIRSTEGGPSIESIFCKHGIFYRMAKKNRVQMYAETISRLAGNPAFKQDGRQGSRPMLFICEGLEHWWRLTPPLVLDDKQPEKGVSKTKIQADHLADAMMYLLMERPHAYTAQERDQEAWESYREEFLEARREADGGIFVDPYATDV